MSNITVKVGPPVGPNISVRVKADGTVEPTNPVIIGPSHYAGTATFPPGTDGEVLQVEANNIVFDKIDGGEY